MSIPDRLPCDVREDGFNLRTTRRASNGFERRPGEKTVRVSTEVRTSYDARERDFPRFLQFRSFLNRPRVEANPSRNRSCPLVDVKPFRTRRGSTRRRSARTRIDRLHFHRNRSWKSSSHLVRDQRRTPMPRCCVWSCEVLSDPPWDGHVVRGSPNRSITTETGWKTTCRRRRMAACASASRRDAIVFRGARRKQNILLPAGKRKGYGFRRPCSFVARRESKLVGFLVMASGSKDRDVWTRVRYDEHGQASIVSDLRVRKASSTVWEA